MSLWGWKRIQHNLIPGPVYWKLNSDKINHPGCTWPTIMNFHCSFYVLKWHTIQTGIFSMYMYKTSDFSLVLTRNNSKLLYLQLTFYSRYKVSLTYTLADPNAQHVQLQQPMVQLCPARVVHEQVVEEGAAPGRQRTQQVAHRQEPRPRPAAPRQQTREDQQYVHQ